MATALAKSELQIYCDDREHALSPILCKNADAIQKRLVHGDIYFEFRGSAVAIFERKTWADFVASLTDGRMGNLADIVQTFGGTQTRVYLILEGLLGKLATKVPHENIFAKIDRLIFRDNVHVIYSVSVEQTAEILARMQKNIAKVLADTSVQQNETKVGGATKCADSKLMTTKKEFTAKDYLCKLGISDGVADAIIASCAPVNHIKVLQGLQISELKYTSGKSVPKKYLDTLVAETFAVAGIQTRLAKAGIRYKVLSELKCETLKKFVDDWVVGGDVAKAASACGIALKKPQLEKLQSVFGT